LGNPCKFLHLGPEQLGAVVSFVSIAVLLLMAIACTPSSVAPTRTALPTTTLVPTQRSTPDAPASSLIPISEDTLSPTIPLALSTPTPASTPDVEREAILSFTLQALEIEAKRNDLIAYFAGLRKSVGIYGQAIANEVRYETWLCYPMS
jgi:hypothetical protein